MNYELLRQGDVHCTYDQEEHSKLTLYIVPNRCHHDTFTTCECSTVICSVASVCVSVCLVWALAFESLDLETVGMQVHIKNIQFKVRYQSDRVSVKVTHVVTCG